MEEVHPTDRAAFRALKSELSIRPIFHQLERCVKAHVLVAFLGYALWVTLKQLLVRKNLAAKEAWSKIPPGKALSMLRSLGSANIVLPTTDRREIRLRRITTPTQQQETVFADPGGIPMLAHLSIRR